MSPKISETPEKDTPKSPKNRVEEVANTFEWLITAFILAFVFRAFVMEAFRIPTGSMADTLKGAHFRFQCRQCGYEYDHGFSPLNYGMTEDSIPMNKVKPPVTKCPSCGYTRSNKELVSVANGDRILVLKCIYQFLEPKRWDVVVFKNPSDPDINYIKRLIALPEEEVEIIDGDIYINGQIQRKPPKVQDELWMIVYDNDYQPVDGLIPSFNLHQWRQPFVSPDSSLWENDPLNPALFHLDSSEEQINSLRYDPDLGNDFKTTYAYNDTTRYDNLPNCSDLMVRFFCDAGKTKGCIGVSLGKYDNDYKGWIDFSGEMYITKNDGQERLAGKIIKPLDEVSDRLTQVRFANVDHMLILEYGDEKLTFDLGQNSNDAGAIRYDIPPRVEIFGAGAMTLSHVAIYRDIHYTQINYRGEFGRATNKPFKLNKDEFFVLGDNSPNSEDCRWWTSNGISNEGVPPYRKGIVPRDFLVGKALFVYWPSGFKPFESFPLNIIPNVGQIRLIYGGSNRSN